MRLLRRTPDPTPQPSTEAPRPERSRGLPRSVFADILDGDHLWLAVQGPTGSLGMRAVGSSEVTLLASDVEPEPPYVSVRASLLDLPDAETFDVVLSLGSGDPRPVWTSPLRTDGPTKIPPSSDGRWQFSLQRTEEETLQIRRVSASPVVEVEYVGVSAGRLVVTVPADAGRLVLVDETGAVVSRPDPAAIGPDDVPGPPGVVLLASVETADGALVPVVRRRNDLTAPNRSTVLPDGFAEGSEPEFEGDTAGETGGETGGGAPAIRLQYQRVGRLTVVRPSAGPA